MSDLVSLSMGVAVLSAVRILLMKKAAKDVSYQTVVFVTAILYALFSLFYVAYHRDTVLPELQNLAVPIILIFVGATLLSFISNILYYKLLTDHSPELVTSLVSTAPVFIIILSYVFLHQNMSNQHMAGVAAILFGTFLLS